MGRRWGKGERERWQMPASQRMARGARLAATHSTQQAGEDAGGGGGGREGGRGKASGTKRCIVPELAARPSLAEWSASVVPGKSGHATKPAIWPAIKVSTVTFLSSTSAPLPLPPSPPTPLSPTRTFTPHGTCGPLKTSDQFSVLFLVLCVASEERERRERGRESGGREREGRQVVAVVVWRGR